MPQEPLFRFIQVGDLHLAAEPDSECTQAKFNAWLQYLHDLPPAELFLLMGDMVDADTVPQPMFVDHTIGYFTDERVALVQLPQEFYNLD